MGALNAADYLSQLQALLPPGPAWPRTGDAPLTALLASLSAELARVDARAWRATDEADPRGALELLSDWERVCGLPDSCSALPTRQLPPGFYPAITAADLVSFERASVATYLGVDGLIHEAAPGEPRVEVDAAGASGLLVEGARTNSLLYSEQFGSVYWVKTRATGISNAGPAPDGSQGAYHLLDSVDVNSHYIWQSVTGTANKYTLSVYAKAVTRSQIALRLFEGPPYARSVYCVFDLASATVMAAVMNGGAMAAGASITPVGNGWFRCSMTVILGGAVGVGQANIHLAAGGNIAYAGDGISGLYVWGAQLEAGASPTSYVPTVAAAVTREADIARIVSPPVISERRAAVVARLTAQGGASPAYFAALASAMGYAIEIDEYRPFVAGLSRCGDVLNGGHAVRHQWRVRVSGPRYTPFRVGASQCGDLLGKIVRAEDLECKLKRLKPAHTHLIFSYEGA